MKAYLCRGWKRTGKDTFFKDLTAKSRSYQWKIYSLPNKCIPFTEKEIIRVALADELKRYTHKFLGLEDFGDPSTYDDVKDKKPVNQISKITYNIPVDIDMIEIMPYLPKHEDATLRDWYIAIGDAYKKLIVPYYWCEKSLPNCDNPIFVTDYRFPLEKEFFDNCYDVSVIHLYRSDVKEPDFQIYSEHALNGETADYLAVPNEDDFLKSVERFPQYRDFVFNSEFPYGIH